MPRDQFPELETGLAAIRGAGGISPLRNVTAEYLVGVRLTMARLAGFDWVNPHELQELHELQEPHEPQAGVGQHEGRCTQQAAGR